MKPAGIAIAATSSVCAAIPAVMSFGGELRVVAVVASLLNALLLAWWLFRITSDWVRATAFAYAQELIATCEQLPDTPADPSKPTIHLPQ